MNLKLIFPEDWGRLRKVKQKGKYVSETFSPDLFQSSIVITPKTKKKKKNK